MRMPNYKDLGDLPEDDRITQIGEKAVREKLIVGFVVDKEPGDAKANRYIDKLKAKFPSIRIIGTFDGPVPDTTLVKVGPPLQ